MIQNGLSVNFLSWDSIVEIGTGNASEKIIFNSKEEILMTFTMKKFFRNFFLAKC